MKKKTYLMNIIKFLIVFLFLFKGGDGLSQDNFIIRRLNSPFYSGVKFLQWSDTGEDLIAATNYEIAIWGKAIQRKEIDDEIKGFSFSNNNFYIIKEKWMNIPSRLEQLVSMPYNLSEEKIIFQCDKISRGNGEPNIDFVASSPKSQLVAIVITRKIPLLGLPWESEIYIYNSNNYAEKYRRVFPSTKFNDLQFSPNGRFLACALVDKKAGSYAEIIDTSNPSLTWTTERYGEIKSVCFSSDGNILFVSYYNNIDLYSTMTHNKIKRFLGQEVVVPNQDILDLAYCPNGPYLASANKNKSITIWDVEQGIPIISLSGHKKAVNSVAFRPDGSLLASGSDDKNVFLWDFRKIIYEHRKKQQIIAEKKAEEERRRLEEPSNLFLTVRFDDNKSYFPNSVLDAAETASLMINLQNSGKGSAFDVSLLLSSDNPYLDLKGTTEIGEIAPNDSQLISIPINLRIDAPDGITNIAIQTKEKRGYDARPVQIQIPVRHLDKPALSFASFALNDATSGMANGNGNGIVENGETVEITAFLKNTGVGASLNTVVNLNSVSQGAEIRQGKVLLGTIAPTETKQAKVVVAIPRTYSGSDLRLAFAARDTIGASQITKEHILPMSKLAPILAFDSRFLDSRGVQVDEVSNGNSYILEIVPRNEGQIAARSVQANITASSGINMSNSLFSVGDIAVGATAAPIRFNFMLPRNYNYGVPQFNLRLSQSDFADVNQKLDIPFRLKSPNLIAREVVTTTDGNANIQQSETVDIDLVVENQGDLDAEGAVADLNFTHTGIDFRERSKTLGRIPAGGQGRARFNFLVKTGAAVGPLVGQLQVRQVDGFAGIAKTLNYTINAIGAQIVTVTPTEQPGTAQRLTPVVRANTPPVVFLSLKNLGAEGKSYDPYVKLEIQIKDDKPMLAVEPEIRVNGKLQPKDQGLRGIGLEERETKEDELKLKMYRLVELGEGLNDIEVRVYDANNEMGMEITQVEYLSQRTDIWAIIIGVGDYQNDQIDDLKFAAADAQSFYDFIRSPEGGNLQADHIKLLLNRDATRENILRDMEWITSKAFENDVVYIYMAMHGMVGEGELYFVAHNSDPGNLLATGVKKSDLENLLQRRMKSNKVAWFVDACHSGSLGEDTQVSMRASRASATNRLLTEISKARNGLAMFMSATAAEFSQEGTKWGGGHGVFTHFLLQGLRGQADRNKDNFVSVPELYDYVSRQVSDATEGKQNPILRGNYDRELKLSTVK